MHKLLLKLFLNSCSDNLEFRTFTEPRRSIENPKWLGLSVIAFVLVVTGAVAQAQQPTKVPRIGYLSRTGDSKNPGPETERFRQGLRDLGYIEGKNILVEYRYIAGKTD